METAALAGQRYVRVTTFKRDGTPVSTPVWCAGDDGSLLVFTEENSGKVKRIRRDAHVRVAPCGARGALRGQAVDADARILDETARVETLLARKYGWVWRGYTLSMGVVRRIRRQPTPAAVALRITPR